MVPTPAECFQLLKEFQVPQHVVDHSRAVHAVALFLCRALNRNGERLDQAKIEAGALLHDVAKISAMGSLEGHAAAGARLLRERGFPEVAEIVRQHVVLDAVNHDGRIGEAEIVHYADKRVKFTAVVPLPERFQDLKERYGRTPEAIAWLARLETDSFALEERLFSRIPIRPEALAEMTFFAEGKYSRADRGGGG